MFLALKGYKGATGLLDAFKKTLGATPATPMWVAVTNKGINVPGGGPGGKTTATTQKAKSVVKDALGIGGGGAAGAAAGAAGAPRRRVYRCSKARLSEGAHRSLRALRLGAAGAFALSAAATAFLPVALVAGGLLLDKLFPTNRYLDPNQRIGAPRTVTGGTPGTHAGGTVTYGKAPTTVTVGNQYGTPYQGSSAAKARKKAADEWSKWFNYQWFKKHPDDVRSATGIMKYEADQFNKAWKKKKDDEWNAWWLSQHPGYGGRGGGATTTSSVSTGSRPARQGR